MKLWEKILLGTYTIFWITAPSIVGSILSARDIILPSDIKTGGVVLWYAIGIAQSLWAGRNAPPKYKSNRGPSYTDKGQNDWMDGD